MTLSAAVVNQFEKGRATRLKCDIDNEISYSCGLNHLGDGNFFIILSKSKLEALEKKIGDFVSFEVYEDPNPLGVDIPETLQVLMEQDEEVKAIFEKLSDGKKRTLIFSISRVKNIDLQVKKILDFIRNNK